MIEHAYIQEVGRGRWEPEMGDLAGEFARRGIPVTAFSEKQMLRGQVAVTPRTLVAGWVSVVERALTQLNVELPPPDDYPDALHPFLRRRVWRTTMKSLKADLELRGKAVFIKPAERRKRFTGRVVETTADLWGLVGVSRNTPLWCSEVVRFVSEQRFFVLRGQVIGARHYDGDLAADSAAVAGAVAAFSQAGAPNAYSLDFGVLANGQTALVERNDAFGLASYGLEPRLYTDLTIARWEGLVGALRRLASPSGIGALTECGANGR